MSSINTWCSWFTVCGPRPDQVTATLAHQPQRDRLVVDHDLAQAAVAQPDDRDRAGVGRVGLAAVAASKIARTRVDSFGGTSTTVSPSAISRCASCTPTPPAPSTAQVRSGHRRASGRISR